MTMQTGRTAVKASALLAAIALSGGAFAAGSATDTYNFEGKADGTALDAAALTGLTGNGTIKADAFSYAGAVGKPVSGTSANVLEIAGTVTYTNATEFTNADKASQVDFMFRVEPTDELEAPTGDDVQVALAVGETNAAGTQASIELWCKVGNTAQWLPLKTVDTGAWVRASIVLDYDAKLCRVALDGDPVKVAGAVTNAWYAFAGGAAGTDHVKSITMVGSTRLDDLVVSHTAVDSYSAPGSSATVAAASSGVNVTYDYMNKYGVSKSQVEADQTVGAGMKVSEKYVAGLDPYSDTKFELKTMTPTDATHAKVTFPGNNTSGYTVTVTTDKAGNSPISGGTYTTGFGNEGTTAAGEKINSATVELPAANDKLYIHVKATK